ncbi:MAG: ABC transporter permease [Treponema sp.]
MLYFVLKRSVTSIFIIIGIVTLLFFLFELQPGNPYLNFIKPGMSPETTKKILKERGYYDSLFSKWKRMSFSLLKLDFGYSLQYSTPVKTLIFQRIPNTLFITIPSLLFAIFISIILGSFSAYYNNSFSTIINFISFIGLCVPAFFISLFLIKIFAFDIELFPISGMKDITASSNFLSYVYHAILPITTLTLLQTFPLVRYVRAFMLSVKTSDAITTYESFGMQKYQAYKKVGMSLVRAKILTMAFMEVPNLIQGALITETIFVWPGIGKLNFDAVLFRDYPLLLGITTITAICVLFSNLILDILNYSFDKRIGL